MRPIDADKLMELYENAPECNIDDCHVSIPVIRQNVLDMPTVNPYEWISVKDRLPDELFTAVLIYCPDNDNIYCAYLNARNEWHIFDQGSGLWVLERVTHWMPLPVPPTEKEN